MRRRRNRGIFKWAYLIYVIVLAFLVVASAFYVNHLLTEYEAAQPEYQVENALQQLIADSSSADTFWTKYSMSEVKNSVYEKDVDLKKDYLSHYSSDELNYIVKNGMYAEDELCYTIRDGKLVLAEVMLKATGPVETKLAVFSSRDWAVESINPIFERNEYEISVPEEFSVSANGIEVSKKDGTSTDDGKILYKLSGLYFEPTLDIKDANGESASFVIKNYKVHTEYYDYTLTLPYTLSVTVNGEVSEGTALANGNIRHDIMLLQKPEVVISDLYGNVFKYDGNELPLTYSTVIAPDNYNVELDGAKIPESAIKVSDIEEYAILAEILEYVPTRCEYNIAVLKDGANISVTDENGKEVTLDKETQKHDLMAIKAPLDNVPDDVANKVDVLAVAQNWSMFMSNDYSFQNLASQMLPDSYQYEVAKKYNSSIDKTMFSNHVLLDPAFTDNEVKNFVWITDDSFSVDVSFVKHMRLVSNQYVDDAMNDRFYFVLHNGEWLLAGLKEVMDNE